MIDPDAVLVEEVSVIDGCVLSIRFTIAVPVHALPSASVKPIVYAPLSTNVRHVDPSVSVAGSLKAMLKVTLPLVAVPDAGLNEKVGTGASLSNRVTLPVAIQRLPARSVNVKRNVPLRVKV